MTLDRVFDMVRTFRQDDTETPIILMGYMNPIERRGLATFVEQAQAAGVDGLLIVDCPADEAEETRAALAGHDMHQVFLVAPTTTESRMERMAPLAGGFVYYVSLKGVTGSAALDADALAPAISKLRAHTPLPVAVGFGISTPDQAADVARVADAVVIGSALVKALDACETVEAAVDVAGTFAEGIARRWTHRRAAHRARAAGMSWFQKLMPSRIRTEGGKSRKVPDGLWTKCKACEAVLYRPELERALMVCPKCDHHMSLTGRARLEAFLDDGDRVELGQDLRPTDPLRFRDTKRTGIGLSPRRRPPARPTPWS